MSTLPPDMPKLPPDEILCLIKLLDIDMRWDDHTRRWRLYNSKQLYYYNVDPVNSVEEWRADITTFVNIRNEGKS